MVKVVVVAFIPSILDSVHGDGGGSGSTSIGDGVDGVGGYVKCFLVCV